MRVWLALLLVLSSVCAVSAQQKMSPSEAREVTLAVQKIQQVIKVHPEPLVREKLWAWIGQERVLFAGNNLVGEVSVSLEKDASKSVVLLWYNFNFVLHGLPQVAAADKADYLNLAIYNEAVQIEEYFAGRATLTPMIPSGPISEANLANVIWDREWTAVSKEWELAKKINKPYLVPLIYAATRKGETPRAFLDGFYLLQMDSHAISPTIAAEYTKRYKQEIAKLAARRAA